VDGFLFFEEHVN